MLYDVITVGGGLAGSTLAKNLAEHGYRVLVLERETHFRDRVRGEQMHPWGVTEARALGIYESLVTAGGHQTRWWRNYQEGELVADRDLAETTPHGVGSFNCYHPAMQEAVLRLAVKAGAVSPRFTQPSGALRSQRVMSPPSYSLRRARPYSAFS